MSCCNSRVSSFENGVSFAERSSNHRSPKVPCSFRMRATHANVAASEPTPAHAPLSKALAPCHNRVFPSNGPCRFRLLPPGSPKSSTEDVTVSQKVDHKQTRSVMKEHKMRDWQKASQQANSVCGSKEQAEQGKQIKGGARASLDSGPGIKVSSQKAT